MAIAHKNKMSDGYPPKEGYTACPPAEGDVESVSLALALTKTWPDDAHVVQYDYTPNATGPLSVIRRLNVDLFRDPAYASEIPKDGVRLSVVLFDVDAEDHKRTAAWWAIERVKIDRLLAAHPGLVVYMTKGGYRIVGVLTAPFVLRSVTDDARWKALYRSWARYLRLRFGIKVDPACDQWNRMFRLPRATRDGVPQHLEIIGDTDAIGVWDPVLRPEEIVQPESETLAGSADFEPVALSYDTPDAYLIYRLDPATKYLERARLACFARSGQAVPRRNVMLGICAALLWKFRLPLDVAGDWIEGIYNPRIVAAGLVPWSRITPGDHGMSIDERLAAASAKSKVSASTDIMGIDAWRAWQELLLGPADPLTAADVDALRVFVAAHKRRTTAPEHSHV